MIGALLIAFYLGWMRYLLRGLQASDQRLSLHDSMTSQARAHSVQEKKPRQSAAGLSGDMHRGGLTGCPRARSCPSGHAPGTHRDR